MNDHVCDHCSWRRTTQRFVDHDGDAAMLCGRCLGRAAELKDAVIRLRAATTKLDASDAWGRSRESQYRRLEEEHQALKERHQKLCREHDQLYREIAYLRRLNAEDDTAVYPAGEASR